MDARWERYCHIKEAIIPICITTPCQVGVIVSLSAAWGHAQSGEVTGGGQHGAECCRWPMLMSEQTPPLYSKLPAPLQHQHRPAEPLRLSPQGPNPHSRPRRHTTDCTALSSSSRSCRQQRAFEHPTADEAAGGHVTTNFISTVRADTAAQTKASTTRPELVLSPQTLAAPCSTSSRQI